MNLYRKVAKLEKDIVDLEQERNELKTKNKTLLEQIKDLEKENNRLTNIVNAKDKKESEFEQMAYEAYQIQGFYKELIECVKETQKEMKKFV